MANGKLYAGLQTGIKRQQQVEQDQLLGDAELYRKALEKAAYGAVGPAFSQGLQGISGYLSHAGPLADSGARAALSARLASGLYGRAASQVGQGYASYLGNLMQQQRNYKYQLALLKAQQKAQKTGIGGILGGVGGTILGGPLGGYAGNYLGTKIFGGQYEPIPSR
jgi:hypothetical protein